MNAFASFACRADDRKTYTKVRSEMKDNVFQEAWRSNYSFDLCKHSFTRVRGELVNTAPVLYFFSPLVGAESAIGQKQTSIHLPHPLRADVDSYARSHA